MVDCHLSNDDKDKTKINDLRTSRTSSSSVRAISGSFLKPMCTLHHAENGMKHEGENTVDDSNAVLICDVHWFKKDPSGCVRKVVVLDFEWFQLCTDSTPMS